MIPRIVHMVWLGGTNRSDVTELPSDTFYPYNWNEDPKPPTARTLAIHKWEGSWLPKLKDTKCSPS